MRAVGLDYGEKNIGVAVSDPLGFTAQGITVIRRKQGEPVDTCIKALKDIISEYQGEIFVLGFPKNMNNTLGRRAEETLAFKSLLEKKTGLPVVLWDERLSSMAAEKMMLEADLSRKKRKKNIDVISAVIILQNYLDFKGNNLE